MEDAAFKEQELLRMHRAGQGLKAKRETLKMTMDEVVDITRGYFSKTRLSNIEAGKVGSINYSDVVLLSAIYGLTNEDIVQMFDVFNFVSSVCGMEWTEKMLQRYGMTPDEAARICQGENLDIHVGLKSSRKN